ncbi:hypothetical protein EB008_01690 [bacterium]|jgi:hypothetical protein|nr:hypothetical protein [bacterium]
MSCNNLSFFSIGQAGDQLPKLMTSFSGLQDNPSSLSAFFKSLSLDPSVLDKVRPFWDRCISLSYLSSAFSIPHSLHKLNKKIFDQDKTAIALQAFKVAKLATDVLIGLEELDVLSATPTQKEALYEFNLWVVVSLAFMHLSQSDQKGCDCKKIARLLLTSVPAAYEVLGPTARDLVVKTAMAGSSIFACLHKWKSKLG